MLTNNVYAIAEALPDKESTPEQEPSVANQPRKSLAPPSRGELLYLNHCIECHESQVHIRAKHHSKNINAIRDEVSRWVKQLGLKWTLHDIEDVVDYLNDHYYHYSD
jgi:hypothetical protein